MDSKGHSDVGILVCERLLAVPELLLHPGNHKTPHTVLCGAPHQPITIFVEDRKIQMAMSIYHSLSIVQSLGATQGAR
jgi:hypothetical protein